jgi:hypothetical protein
MVSAVRNGAVACRSGTRDIAHEDIKAYYDAKIVRYGATPRGVDWSCIATQNLRFVQLLKICDFDAPFSLNDVGCGYGALIDFLSERYPDASVDYLGTDLSPAMVRHGRRLHRHCSFVVSSVSPRVADYSVASGILNVMLDHSRDVWEDLVAQTLGDLHRTSRWGFAVNFMAEELSGHSSRQLYQTNPDQWRRYCQSQLECSVETVLGYGMREFTLLVRRK